MFEILLFAGAGLLIVTDSSEVAPALTPATTHLPVVQL